MAKLNNCNLCGKPIHLNPSAAERAAKDRSGRIAEYFRNLFTTHPDCQIASWYGRPIPSNPGQ